MVRTEEKAFIRRVTQPCRETLNMPRIVKAKYSKGKIVLLEKVDIEEGKELLITLNEPPASSKTRFEKAAGEWKGLVDTDKLINDIYTDRLVSTRSKAEL